MKKGYNLKFLNKNRSKYLFFKKMPSLTVRYKYDFSIINPYNHIIWRDGHENINTLIILMIYLRFFMNKSSTFAHGVMHVY